MKKRTTLPAATQVKSPFADAPPVAHVAPSGNGLDDFIRRLKHCPDYATALNMASEYAVVQFNKLYLAELTSLYIKRDALQEEVETRQAHLKLSLSCLLNTDPYREAVIKDDDNQPKPLRWKHWRSKDRVQFSLLAGALVTSVGVGFSNVYLALMSTGEAVYLSSPVLTGLTAAILPLASLSIERIYHFFQLDSTKRRYTFSVFGATALLALLWTIQFALHTAGGVDLNSIDLDELDSGKSEFLVLTQILLELFTASSLGLAMDRIVQRYDSESQEDNPALIKQRLAHASTKADFKASESELSDCNSRIAELENLRQDYINDKTSQYLVLAGHQAQANVINY